MDFENFGTVRQGTISPASSSGGCVDSRLPPLSGSLSPLPQLAIENVAGFADRNSLSRTVNPASTERCRINMSLAAEGAGIAADLRRRRTSRHHKLNLLDDLREFRDILERAEWALEAAQAAVIDAQADVANALFACEEAGCVDIAGEPLEEFS